MPTVTLDTIRADLDSKYGPLVVPFGDGLEVAFVQSLRLPKDKRKAIAQIQQDRAAAATAKAAEAERLAEQGELPERDFDADEAETLGYLRDLLRLAATDADAADLLFAEIGDDVLLLQDLLILWTRSTQPGEASPSAS